MKRPILFFIASYICGIVAAELFRYFPLTVLLVAMFLSVPVGYLCAKRFIPLPVVIIGVAAGFLYMLYVSRIPPNDISNYAAGEKLIVVGMVDEPAKFYHRKMSVVVTALKIMKGDQWLDVTGRIRLNIYGLEAGLNYGDVLRFTGRLKEIRGFKNPGLFDYASYVSREGLRASLSIGKKDNITKIGRGGNPVLRRLYEWRDEIRLSIGKGLSENSSAILQSMVIGATGELAPEVRDKFTAAGVMHILSISGSHLGFVTFLTFLIIRHSLIYLPYRMLLRISLLMTPSKIAALCTFPPVIFYTLISGSAVATVRSLIMALVYLAAILIEREDDALNTLAVAALIVLLWDPQALFDISFQLSYMAVFSMIMVMRRFCKVDDAPSGWKDKYVRRLKLLILLNLGASISTAPLVAHYYNQITWVGIVSNMVITPFVGFTVLPAGLLSGIFSLILQAEAIPLAWLNELLMGLLYRMVEFFAGFPLSTIYIRSPSVPVIFFMYILLFSLLFFKYSFPKVSVFVSAILLMSYSGCNAILEGQSGLLRVTFLDVGQGDSALIEFHDRITMLIDGGGIFSDTFDTGRSVVAPYMWNKGIGKIDYIVASHPQIDHIKGLAYVADKFQIREAWTNGKETGSSHDFYSVAARKGIKMVNIHSGEEDRVIGGCKVSFLNPPAISAAYGLDDNDLSIVMRINCNDISFLFTGDIGRKAIRRIIEGGGIMESTVIKVPHHGARGSVEEDFISRIRPSIAVISAGYQNSYHHPSREAISSYSKAGAIIYRTDLDGAVIVELRDGRIKVRRYEDMIIKEVDFRKPGSIFKSELININRILEDYGRGIL